MKRPMFTEKTDINGVHIYSNCHDELDYESRTREPLSRGVARQVLFSAGARVGSKSFDSLLEPSEER